MLYNLTHKHFQTALEAFTQFKFRIFFMLFDDKIFIQLILKQCCKINQNKLKRHFWLF